jgi:hypothetical protein
MYFFKSVKIVYEKQLIKILFSLVRIYKLTQKIIYLHKFKNKLFQMGN